MSLCHQRQLFFVSVRVSAEGGPRRSESIVWNIKSDPFDTISAVVIACCHAKLVFMGMSVWLYVSLPVCLLADYNMNWIWCNSRESFPIHTLRAYRSHYAFFNKCYVHYFTFGHIIIIITSALSDADYLDMVFKDWNIEEKNFRAVIESRVRCFAHNSNFSWMSILL